MNKYIFWAVAGILALSGCSKIDDNQDALRQMTFSAGFSDCAETRATLDPSTKNVSFSAKDAISILSVGNDNVKFTTTAGGASATFEGTAVPGKPKYYAVYPYQGGLTLDGTTIKGITIPDIQTAASTYGWDPAAPIAYATTTGSSLTFSNLCALLKVTNNLPKGVDIYIFDTAATVPMTGTFDLDTSTGTLTSSNSVVGVLAQGVPAGKTVYLAIAPCSVSSLEAWALGTSDWWKITKTSPAIFESGKIYDLGNTSDWPIQ